MALSGEEIRARLSAFAAHWSVYEGSERSEAQTFLNELFDCYGTLRSKVAMFEQAQSGRFLDLIWPRVCLIEMKAPSEAKKLAKHRQQALDYWRDAAVPDKGIPSPEYVVICAFRRLEVWQPGKFPKEPRVALDLIDLPDQYDVLLFLAGREPVFTGGQAALTREAVVHITDLYDRLRERHAGGVDVLRDFVLQSVWSLFAEDLGQIPEHRFTQVVDGLLGDSRRSSADEIHGLFEWLNDPASERPQHGLYAGTPFANGGLFEQPARVHLEQDELEHLRAAAEFNWRLVEPSIFGSLLEGGLGHDKQWALGAHYTHEADIRKVVQPTIVDPWQERIEGIKTHAEAVAAQNDLMNYVVLDPACGSGNFLYVAYRELRRLEKHLREREQELRKKAGLKDQEALSLYFPLQNIRGIEIDGFAVALARVTLWMGHKLAVDELELSEATLPLADLSGIQVGDALKMDWPRADAIIGNPPFHGSQQLRGVLGDAYVDWLKTEFKVGLKDYCIYWFRKAHDSLVPGDRAGLVGTNSISQNRARGPSLDYIVRNGGVITSAVSKQPWPGEAVVNVSIVNWIKGYAEGPFILDGAEVDAINSSLTPRVPTSAPSRLRPNLAHSFQGVTPTGDGFVLDDDEARALLLGTDADYADVVRPYLTGDDLADDPCQAPGRWIIDFSSMPLEEAAAFPAALAVVRERVKPERDSANREPNRTYWWRFERPRPAMRRALAGLDKFIAMNRYGKRVLTAWAPTSLCPSGQVIVFTFDDDFALGVLTSSIHAEWAWRQSSTLRVDLRYTPTSAFETFPWPNGNREIVGQAARLLHRRRSEICVEQRIGLTKLYNQMDEGAWAELLKLHRSLDEAVAVAYGWPANVAHDPDETNRRLLELNRAVAAGEIEYDRFN